MEQITITLEMDRSYPTTLDRRVGEYQIRYGELSRESGIHKSQFSRWRNTDQEPSLPNVIRIEKAISSILRRRNGGSAMTAVRRAEHMSESERRTETPDAMPLEEITTKPIVELAAQLTVAIERLAEQVTNVLLNVEAQLSSVVTKVESGVRNCLTQKEAAAYLSVEESWLDDAPMIPWVDIRKPGARKAVRRFRKVDLDRFLEQRLVQPGQPNPLAEW